MADRPEMTLAQSIVHRNRALAFLYRQAGTWVLIWSIVGLTKVL